LGVRLSGSNSSLKPGLGAAHFLPELRMDVRCWQGGLGCLIILWLLGLVTSYTIGGVIHVLLVIALVMVLVNFISGRRGAR